MKNPKVAHLLYCTFCSKCQTDVERLIAGPSVYICNECVGMLNHMLDETLGDDIQRSGVISEKEIEVTAETLRALIRNQPGDARLLVRKAPQTILESPRKWLRAAPDSSV